MNCIGQWGAVRHSKTRSNLESKSWEREPVALLFVKEQTTTGIFRRMHSAFGDHGPLHLSDRHPNGVAYITQLQLELFAQSIAHLAFYLTNHQQWAVSTDTHVNLTIAACEPLNGEFFYKRYHLAHGVSKLAIGVRKCSGGMFAILAGRTNIFRREERCSQISKRYFVGMWLDFPMRPSSTH